MAEGKQTHSANGRARRASAPSSATGRATQRKRAPDGRRVAMLAKRQLDLFISLEPKVLRGNDAEAVHDIRVASRRLQQILDLMYPKPRPAKLRKLRRTIRRSRRALSTARNCDVLLERVEKALERKQLPHREVWAAFRQYLREQRESSFPKALHRLSGLNLPGFYVSLKEFLEETSDWKAPSSAASRNHRQPEATSIGDSIPGRITEALEETWSGLAACMEKAREQTTAPALHAVRIAAKRVRYLMEVIHELGAAESEQALDCLRRAQQHLGDWHDLEVMEESMLEMVSRRKFLQKHLELALESGKVVSRNRRTKQAFEEKFFMTMMNSREWTRLESWVSAFLSVPALPTLTAAAPRRPAGA